MKKSTEELILSEITKIHDKIGKIRSEIGEVRVDIADIGGEIKELHERVKILEWTGEKVFISHEERLIKLELAKA